MKKVFLLLVLIISFTACKSDKKEDVVIEEVLTKAIETKTGEFLLEGGFIYYADAAVLQTKSEIYGVKIDSMMHVLDTKAKAYKTEATDMVPVVIKGKVSEKPEGQEGWPYIVEVKQIIKLSKPKPEENQVIKLGKE